MGKGPFETIGLDLGTFINIVLVRRRNALSVFLVDVNFGPHGPPFTWFDHSRTILAQTCHDHRWNGVHRTGAFRNPRHRDANSSEHLYPNSEMDACTTSKNKSYNFPDKKPGSENVHGNCRMTENYETQTCFPSFLTRLTSCVLFFSERLSSVLFRYVHRVTVAGALGRSDNVRQSVNRTIDAFPQQNSNLRVVSRGMKGDNVMYDVWDHDIDYWRVFESTQFSIR